MADGKRLDPHRGYNFKVSVTNKKISASVQFAKIDGLEVEVEVAEYREGTDTATVRKLPGLAKYPNLKMERGVTDNEELVGWIQEVVNLTQESGLPPDDEFRAEVTIEKLNRRKETIRTWTFRNAWPCKFGETAHDAKSSDILMEFMELTHEGSAVELQG